MQLGSLLRTSTSHCFPLPRRDFVADRNHVAALILERWEMTLFISEGFFFFSPHLSILKSRRSSVKVAGGLSCYSISIDSSFFHKLQRSFKESRFPAKLMCSSFATRGSDIRNSCHSWWQARSQLITTVQLGFSFWVHCWSSALDWVAEKSGSHWVWRERRVCWSE